MEHGVVVDARWLAELSPDVAHLSRGVLAAFLGSTTTPGSRPQYGRPEDHGPKRS